MAHPADSSRSWRAVVAACALAAMSWNRGIVVADDWPQWRGPRRDAVSAETGLLRAWPAGGPRLAWQAAGLGTGYSGVVVSRGRVFTIGCHDSAVVATCLDEAAGKPVWTRRIGETSRIPSSTPTVDEDRLYALDPDGELVCLNSASGEILWQKSFSDDFGGRMMSGRGYGESPLVDGDRLVCTPGGEAAAVVALDKRTGDVQWKSRLPEIGPAGRDGAGFSSIVVTQACGLRQYVQLMGRGLVGVDARDGRFLWGHNGIANDTANIPTPVVTDDLVFSANGYSAGSVLLKLSPEDTQGVKADVVYSLTSSQFQNHHGGVVLRDGRLYGGHGNNNGLPTCLDFATGRVLWKRRGPGTGSAAVVCADGHLYFRYQNGVVALIEQSDRRYKAQGTFQIPGAGGDSWAHPAIANGRLFLREQDALWVYDLRSGSDAVATEEPDPSPPSAAAVALRNLGVLVEPLTGSGRSVFHFADAHVEGDPSKTPAVVTLAEAHLTKSGALGENVLGLLKALPGPLVVSLSGTRISAEGLQQLQGLDVAGLSLEFCSQVTDADMARVRRLKPLRVLVLAGTAISHTGIQSLVDNTNLTALDLEACDSITDAACEPLGKMRQLRALVLKKSGFEKQRITNAGLKQLGKLDQLELLILYGNQVTDEGLANLAPLGNLRELDLSLLAITDEGLAALKPLKALQSLNLLYSEGFAGPMLSDRGMASLLPLTNLKRLNLTGAKLTDEGLAVLTPLKGLKELQLVRTRISSEGVKAFRTALPECHVSR